MTTTRRYQVLALLSMALAHITAAADRPTPLSIRLADLFVRDTSAVHTACIGHPYDDAALANILRPDISVASAQDLAKEIAQIRDHLAQAQSTLLFSTLQSSDQLARIGKLAVIIDTSDVPDAHPDSVANAITITTGLMRDDLITALGAPLPLCGAHFPERYRQLRKNEFDAAAIREIDTILEFIISFQFLHEAGHVLLSHVGEHQRCEEADADRFAYDYLYATLNPVMRAPLRFSTLTIELTWPRGARDWTDISTHPTLREREDRIFRSRMLRLMQARSSWERDKLSPVGAFSHGTLLDQDVYAANWELEELLSSGPARCSENGVQPDK